ERGGVPCGSACQAARRDHVAFSPCRRAILIPQGQTIRMRIFCIVLAWGAILPAFPQAIPQSGDWPAYGPRPGWHPLFATRSDQYKKCGDATACLDLPHDGTRPIFREYSIFVDNVLYLSTHTQKVIALDPESGREIWRYDAKAPGRENRGVAYWRGDSREPPRILFGTGDGRLIALAAKTGVPLTRLRRQRCGQPAGRHHGPIPQSRLRHHLAAYHLPRPRDCRPCHAGRSGARAERRPPRV